MFVVGDMTAAPPAATARVTPLAETLADDLAAAWDDLAAAAAEPNPFHERWFVEASRPLAPARGVRLVQAWAGTRLIGLLPVTIAPRYGRLPVSHVENWVHYHSFLGTPLLRAGAEPAAAAALLSALDAAEDAPGFLHLVGLVEDGAAHRALAGAGRRCDVVHRSSRALLQSGLAADDYYAATVRKKKRKEIKRLQARLAELGEVCAERLEDRAALPAWTADFLRLERSGWKGAAGTALSQTTETDAFFRQAMAGAADAGRLEMIRLTVDGRPIAMLVNLLAPPGAFTFKIAYDEDWARFSPGVLVQLENLAILGRPDIAWMDSCAVEDHPMINSLWGERRSLVRLTLPLAGWRRRATFAAVRAAEEAHGAVKRRLGRG